MIEGDSIPRAVAAREDPVILEVRNASKRYGTATALEHVDLFVRRGEFVSLLGPSGSGKTTMLNLIAGMVAPSAGEIWIDGVNATATPPSGRGLGMVFQNYALMPHMTVFENVAFPLQVRRLPRREVESRVIEVLELVQLAHLRDRRPRELSGGQQQRTAIARCIVYAPAITLMDEPLGALDKRLRDQMQFELKRLHERLGMTIVYVTHDQQEALTMSDRVVLMNVGRIEQIGTPAQLYAEPVSVFAAEFLGESNLMAGTVAELGDAAIVQLDGIGPVQARLRPGLHAGQAVVTMVRPENVSLSVDGAPADANRARGTVIDSSMLGSAVKHQVQLTNQTVMLVEVLNRADAVMPVRGSEVSLSWRPADTLVLPVERSALTDARRNG